MREAKKNILILMTALNGGGAEKVLIDLLKHFDYNRFDITLSLVYSGGIYLNQIPTEVRQKPLFGSKDSFARKVTKWLYHKLHWLMPLKLWLLMNHREDYDTIISFMESEPVLYHYCLMKRAKRHLTWVHTDFVTHHWSKTMFAGDDEQRIYGLMDTIVFVSSTTQDKFNQVYKCLAPQIVIHNFVDYNYVHSFIGVKRLPVDADKLIICSVGSLWGVKRYDKLINAAAILNKNNLFDKPFEVWIIGEGPDRHKLEQQIHDLQLEHVVILKGFHQPPYELMAQADMFVSTSEAEGFPIAMSEALCLSLPVVATNTTGACELLQTTYGVITGHEDGDIKDGILRVLSDIENYKELARQRAEELFVKNNPLNQIYSII